MNLLIFQNGCSLPWPKLMSHIGTQISCKYLDEPINNVSDFRKRVGFQIDTEEKYEGSEDE